MKSASQINGPGTAFMIWSFVLVKKKKIIVAGVAYKALTIKQTNQTSNNRVRCKLIAAMGGGIISYRRTEGKRRKKKSW